MKKLLVMTVLFMMLTLFTGCYTVLWTPDKEFPARETASEEYYYDSYYATPYYGNYYYYYESPWWYDYTPPAVISKKSGTTPGRDAGERVTRTGDGERETPRRPSPTGTSSGTTPIYDNAPVTVPASGGSGTKTDAGKSDSGSRSSSTSSDTRSGSSDSSGRNKDGERNNDGGRR